MHNSTAKAVKQYSQRLKSSRMKIKLQPKEQRKAVQIAEWRGRHTNSYVTSITKLGGLLG